MKTKKVFVFALIVVIIFSSNNVAALDTNTNEEIIRESRTSTVLNYWYSDSLQICYWSSTPSIVVHKLTNRDDFPLFTTVYSAATKWNNVLHLSMAPSMSTSNNNDGDIDWCGGTHATLRAWIPDWPWDTSIVEGTYEGYTYWDRDDSGLILRHENTYTYGTRIIDLYENLEMHVAIAFRAGKSTVKYENTSLHELCHALGYVGHDSDNSSLMRTTNTNLTTIDNRTKNHILQVY